MSHPQEIALINCPFGQLEHPDRGLADLASYLNHNGIHTEVFDLNIELFEQLQRPSLWQRKYLYSQKKAFDHNLPLFEPFIQEQVARLVNSDFRIFGFTTHQYNLLFVNQMAEKLGQAKECTLVYGGPSVHVGKERDFLYRSHNVVYVTGQGEPVLLPFLDDCRRGELKRFYDEKDYPPIDEEGFITTFDEFEIDRYTGATLPLLFNYGCQSNCTLCNKSIFFRGLKTKNITRLVHEIHYYKEKTRQNFFEFFDLSINARPQKTIELCQRLIDEKVEIRWGSNASPNRFFTPQNATLLRQSGCEYLRMGIESGSPVVLRKMNKPFLLRDAQAAIRNGHEAGIRMLVNLIVGFPGEGDSEFAETLAFVRENRRFIDRVDYLAMCYITPCSDLDLNPERYNIIKSPQHPESLWYSRDCANTYEIRKARQRQLLELLDHPAIPHSAPDSERIAHHFQSWEPLDIWHDRIEYLVPRSIGVRELLTGNLPKLQAILGERIELVFSPPDEKFMIEVDPEQVSFALQYIAADVRNAMPKGGRMTLQVHSCDLSEQYRFFPIKGTPGRYVQIVVSDTRHGVDDRILRSTLEPQRSSMERVADDENKMAIVNSIVLQNKGFVVAGADPQKGATIQLHFRAVTDNPPCDKRD